MNTLQGFTSQPKQSMSFVLPDGSTVFMLIQYRQQQVGWFADLAWQSWTLNGLRLTSSPNLLQQYQNVIPFGLAIISANNVEPLNVTDFSDGTSVVWLLNADDVALVNQLAFGRT